MKFKQNLKLNILKQVQKNLLRHPREINFHEIFNIHEFYDEIDKISDWPFNPTSIRKLTITFSTSVLPLLLSFFGIGL